MLDQCWPPAGAVCASCGEPAYLRLVVLNYPDQERINKHDLIAYVDAGDPRPLPVTLDLCKPCWWQVGRLTASNVWRDPTHRGQGAVLTWPEWQKTHPPRVFIRQPDDTYKSAEQLEMERGLGCTMEGVRRRKTRNSKGPAG